MTARCTCRQAPEAMRTCPIPSHAQWAEAHPDEVPAFPWQPTPTMKALRHEEYDRQRHAGLSVPEATVRSWQFVRP